MEFEFFGVRGSYPIASPKNVKYGGNSSSIYIKLRDGSHIFYDGGTGLRVAGNKLLSQGFFQKGDTGHILISHTHWDHIMGLPFFNPFYIKNNKFFIYSAKLNDIENKHIFYGQHDQIYYPVPFEMLSAEIIFKPINLSGSFKIGTSRITTIQLNHPGVTLGFRIEADGKCLVILSDTAPFRKIVLGEGMNNNHSTPNDKFVQKFLKGVLSIAHKADYLVYDTHFDELELEKKYHWGHSSFRDALEIATLSGTKKLFMFHHSPEKDDNKIDSMLAEYQKKHSTTGIEIFASYEGLKIES